MLLVQQVRTRSTAVPLSSSAQRRVGYSALDIGDDVAEGDQNPEQFDGDGLEEEAYRYHGVDQCEQVEMNRLTLEDEDDVLVDQLLQLSSVIVKCEEVEK